MLHRSTSSFLTVALCALGFLAASSPDARAVPQGSLELWGTPSGPGQLPPYGSTYVSFGRKTPLAIRTDGAYKAWGSAYSSSPAGETFLDVSYSPGPLTEENALLRVRGDGSLDTQGNSPGVPAGTGFAKVDGGYWFGLALHSGGVVHAFGVDEDGQVDDVPAAATYTDIAATYFSSHLLHSNGSIESYGYASNDTRGLISGTPAGNDFMSIVGGRHTMLALRTDGSIAAWGDDSTGTVSDAPTGTGFQQLAIYHGAAIALHQDGWVTVWGVPAGSPLVDDAPTGARFAAVGIANGMAYAIRQTQVGVSLCRADGSDGIVCPCGNDSEFARGAGCSNSTGKGAILTSTGSASVAADDLVFHVLQARPGQPGVLIEGANWIQTSFRDGVLCAGSPTERVEVFSMDQTGAASSTVSILDEGTVTNPGSNRFYQVWYRDPAVSVCGTGSNLTNAVRVGWEL